MTEPANTGTSTAEGTQTGQEDPPGTGGQQTGQEGTGSTQDPEKGKEPAEPDYRALYEKTLAESRKWESRSKDNASKAKRWDEAEAANRTEAEQAADRAEKAEARATAAITSAVNAEIRAAAGAWTNPADAVRYLDDKDRYVTDDGEIDTKAVAAAVAAVAKERSYLLAANGSGKRGPNPDPGQGARGSASITDQIRDAERKGDHRTALALKAQQLLGAKR